MNNRNQHELDALYHSYKTAGLKECCPADGGDERAEWQVKRLYLACRMFVERLEEEAPPHQLEEAASLVGIATRMPGWAALEGAFREATQAVIEEAEEADLRESKMTHYSIEVTGRWVNDRTSITKSREVVFHVRIDDEDAAT